MAHGWYKSMVLNQGKRLAYFGAVVLWLCLFAGTASAQLKLPEGDEYSVNDFGGIGLMQTRTARFAPDGQLNIGASFVNPYRRYFMTWQILPRFEFSFRYTDVQNYKFGSGPFYLSQEQFFSNLLHFRNGGTNLDRGFDMKVRLAQEGKYMPAIALGLQDFIGTGLFSGEYIVASKNFGPLDFSIGIGWGEVGNRGHFSNPLSILGEKYKTRTGRSDFGGLPLFNRLFTGPEVALFGGVEYFTGIQGLSIKAEYNGTDHNKLARADTGARFIHEKSAFAIGLNYRPAPWFDVSVGWERGNSLMLRGSFRANLNRPGVPKAPVSIPDVKQRSEVVQLERDSFEIAPDYEVVMQRSLVRADFNDEEVGARSEQAQFVIDGSVVLARENDEKYLEQSNEIFPKVQRLLQRRGFWAYGLKIEDDTATIYLANTLYTQVPRNVGLVARIINNHLPSNVEKITVVELIANFEISRISVMRSDIERQARHMSSAEEIWNNTVIDVPQSDLLNPEEGAVEPRTYPSKTWWLTPELKQHLGSPSEGVYLADLDLEAGVIYSPMPGLSLSLVGRRYIAGALDSIASHPNSSLPHVRTDLVEYLTGGRTSIKTMQADYIGSLKPDWYYRVAVGLFEPMYGGIGTEVLYRPYGKPWAFSVELDWVKQRDFKQLFGFRDYAIVTGHATLNYDLPFYGMRTTISAGRYLAGDYGMTFEVSRRFDNGVRVGAFFTRTNVSAEDFGEGSFDKGFYIKFPFSVFLSNYSKQEANFLFKPLTRDGGQKVGIGPSLFELVDKANYRVINREWRTISN